MFTSFNDRADLFAVNSAVNIFGVGKREYQNRDMVIHGQRGRGGVHNAEALIEHVHVTQVVVLLGIRVDSRIGIVHAVYVLCQQDNVRADLCRTQNRCGVGREERAAGAAAEDNHTALFQMTGRAWSGCTAQRSCSSR